MGVDRNFNGVQFAELRSSLDLLFATIHDELEICYYQFWKKGLSRPFKSYDVQATPELSKALFDKLHALIWHIYNVRFDEENRKQPGNKRLPTSAYDDYVEGGVVLSKRTTSAAAIVALKAEQIEITDL